MTGKSIARYVIESDPNYIPPPPPFSDEVLEKRPVGSELTYMTVKRCKPNTFNATEANKI